MQLDLFSIAIKAAHPEGEEKAGFVWVAAHTRNGREVRGHWRAKKGGAKPAAEAKPKRTRAKAKPTPEPKPAPVDSDELGNVVKSRGKASTYDRAVAALASRYGPEQAKKMVDRWLHPGAGDMGNIRFRADRSR